MQGGNPGLTRVLDKALAGYGNPLTAGCYPLGCLGLQVPANVGLHRMTVVSSAVECNANASCKWLQTALLNCAGLWLRSVTMLSDLMAEMGAELPRELRVDLQL